MKKYFLLVSILLLLIANLSFAQGVAVNTDGSTADPSAMLDVKSNNQGILIPRVSSTASITSPVTGLLIFQTTAPIGFYYYDGATWDYLQNSANANVTLKGNTFNGNNQLVQLDGSGRLPAIDGSLLTNLPAGGAAAAGTLTGTTLASNVVNSSISKLSALTSNGIVTTNGGTGALSVTSTTGSGNVVLSTSPTLVTPSLGTPSALVGTNISGTAANLTVGNVITNANLTGDVTSIGNATTIANSGIGGNHIVTALGSATTGTIPAARLGTSSGSSTTFLNGAGAFTTPANSNTFAYGGPLPNGGIISSTSVNVFYTAADGFTITLPPATKAGQYLIIADNSPSGSGTGINIQAPAGSTITDEFNGAVNLSLVNGGFRFALISDGSGRWYTITYP
jgi:hypothetical protein